MEYIILGATTNVGYAIVTKLLDECKHVRVMGRNPIGKGAYKYLDLENENTYCNIELKRDFILISVAPAWKVIKLLEYLGRNGRDFNRYAKALIFMSSSSIYTKLYSFGQYDKDIADKLLTADKQVEKFSRLVGCAYCIVYPTLIYGKCGPYNDRNLSIICQIIEKSPLIILPSRTGLRQPIHAAELACIVVILVEKYRNSRLLDTKITIGGNVELSYLDMIRRLSKNCLGKNANKKLRILLISDRAYYMLVMLVALLKPDWLPILLRIQANLSGFTKVCQIDENLTGRFPINPIG